MRIAHPNRPKKLSRDILGLMDKSIILSHCEFSLTNLHSVEGLHFVPKSNPLNQLILLYICSDNTQSLSRTAHFSDAKGGLDFLHCL